MTKTLIAAVIVTYNRKTLLEDCVNAVLAQTLAVDRLVIIDNASTDGTVQWIQDSGLPENQRVHYCRMEYNAGGAGGFAEGIRQAMGTGADWIWLRNL